MNLVLTKKIEKKEILSDKYGRFMRKLRVSLTDSCNFRCFYCMPLNAKFMPVKNYLPPEKIFQICQILTNLGVNQIRITGGEPTLRKDFNKIIQKIGSLSSKNLKKFGMTTNGWNLQKILPELANANCYHINISLDSLQEEKFNQITNSKKFKNITNGILKAKELGFTIKINTVLLKGLNDDEIFDFLKFSAKYDIPVRFLEAMRIGLLCNNQKDFFISANEIIKKIKTCEELIPLKSDHDSTSFNFKIQNGANIGFIASESIPFCNSCSRLRLSASGKLRACLMSSKGIDISKIDLKKNQQIIKNVIIMKPNFRLAKITQNMNQIGG